MAQERRINVKQTQHNVYEGECDSMRDRFEKEMHRVEEEMQRLRREFEGYTPSTLYDDKMTAIQNPQQRHSPGSTASNGSGGRGAQQYSTSSSSNYYNSNSAGSGAAGKQLQTVANPAFPPKYDPYLESIKSPLIKDDSDGKTLRLRFDVSQYAPEEVTVKTVDHRLMVHAKHEEKSQGKTVYREYNQEFMLPRGTNPEAITSTLSVDGILTVEAPLPGLASGPQREAITNK